MLAGLGKGIARLARAGMSTEVGRSAIIGAGVGAGTSLVSGGNVFSGAIHGGMWGAGLGFAGRMFGGAYKTMGQDPFRRRAGFMQAAAKQGFIGPKRGRGGGFISAAGVPKKGGAGVNIRWGNNYTYARSRKMGSKWPVGAGIGVGGGNVGVSFVHTNMALTAQARISTLTGIAAGALGTNGRPKSNTTMMANSGYDPMGGYGMY